jgi:glycosyltransferase involved in cell wall biosynthesis
MARIAILLSTHNGERFLPEQLDSIATQTHRDWVLYWRDDGSTDGTISLMRDFAARLGTGRIRALSDPGRYGATESFFRLLRAGEQDDPDMIAFADQDDVWIPEKLSRGAESLGRIPADSPALYFARQKLVDSALRPLGLSPAVRRSPGFPAALTQNVATGCTLMLNRAAAALVARSTAPAAANHDWWCYLLVAAAGGSLLPDTTPVVLYRQHGDNAVGAPASLLGRGLAALRRGPRSFMNVLQQHMAALVDQQHLISPLARTQLASLERALKGRLPDRIRALRMPGLRRQTWLETVVFRAWFLMG